MMMVAKKRAIWIEYITNDDDVDDDDEAKK
jgi:hypothetical protein